MPLSQCILCCFVLSTRITREASSPKWLFSTTLSFSENFLSLAFDVTLTCLSVCMAHNTLCAFFEVSVVVCLSWSHQNHTRRIFPNVSFLNLTIFISIHLWLLMLLRPVCLSVWLPLRTTMYVCSSKSVCHSLSIAVTPVFILVPVCHGTYTCPALCFSVTLSVSTLEEIKDPTRVVNV